MRRGGRLLLLLGVLIAALAALVLYVVLVNGSSLSNPNAQLVSPTVELRRSVVSASADIQPGTVLSDTAFLTTEDIPESEYNANPKQYFLSTGELQNKVTLRAVSEGQPIRQDDVIDTGLSLQIPPAQEGQPRPKAYAFQVNNLSGVADQISPNDFVDVLATFDINTLVFRPSFNPDGTQITTEQEVPASSTKTLVQNVQVLKILKPQAPPAGTPTPGGSESAAPETDASGQPVQNGQGEQGQQGATGNTFAPGTWLLVLAVTDQQAEVIKYAVERGNGMTLVLRGRGDTAVENTIGTTLDILITQFGLPQPRPVAPGVITSGQLTPVSGQPAPPAAPPAAPTGTPTP